ncbi:MAG: 50S ribosomal protein L5 [Methanosphaera sp. SHI613]|jgi:large subunit ribosomal protein L5|nr:MAG: 50S ribosomal protein L5 [Methanosphaera sp. SHI613]
MNIMEKPRIQKATVNIGVGEGGERLTRAESLLTSLVDQQPVRTYSKVTNPEFGIRKKQPIACKVTLRGEKAEKIISMVLNGLENRIKASQFDKEGNVSFGIREHIDIPGVRYDPDIGIFGMDVSVTFEKPGHRIKERRLRPKKIPKHQRVTPEEAMELMKEKFQVTIE